MQLTEHAARRWSPGSAACLAENARIRALHARTRVRLVTWRVNRSWCLVGAWWQFEVDDPRRRGQVEVVLELGVGRVR